MMCVHATQMFLEFLQLEGFKWDESGVQMYSFDIDSSRNPDPVTFASGSNESGRHRAPWHCIAETPDSFIDWTARQYTEKAPFPYVLPKTKAFAVISYAASVRK